MGEPMLMSPPQVAGCGRITVDAGKMGGQACIRGLRIPVDTITGQLALGRSWEDILLGYPDLEPEDIQAALDYTTAIRRHKISA